METIEGGISNVSTVVPVRSNLLNPEFSTRNLVKLAGNWGNSVRPVHPDTFNAVHVVGIPTKDDSLLNPKKFKSVIKLHPVILSETKFGGGVNFVKKEFFVKFMLVQDGGIPVKEAILLVNPPEIDKSSVTSCVDLDKSKVTIPTGNPDKVVIAGGVFSVNPFIVGGIPDKFVNIVEACKFRVVKLGGNKGNPVIPGGVDNVVNVGGIPEIVVKLVKDDRFNEVNSKEAVKFKFLTVVGNPDNPVIPGGVLNVITVVGIPDRFVIFIQFDNTRVVTDDGIPARPVIPTRGPKESKFGGRVGKEVRSVEYDRSKPVSCVAKLDTDVILGGVINDLTLEGNPGMLVS